jgi:hypothetical protein
MCFDVFPNLMSAVYLAEQMQRIVPAEVASESNPEAIRDLMAGYYRRATLAAIGRTLGGTND